MSPDYPRLSIPLALSAPLPSTQSLPKSVLQYFSQDVVYDIRDKSDLCVCVAVYNDLGKRVHVDILADVTETGILDLIQGKRARQLSIQK